MKNDLRQHCGAYLWRRLASKVLTTCPPPPIQVRPEFFSVFSLLGVFLALKTDRGRAGGRHQEVAGVCDLGVVAQGLGVVGDQVGALYSIKSRISRINAIKLS